MCRPSARRARATWRSLRRWPGLTEKTVIEEAGQRNAAKGGKNELEEDAEESEQRMTTADQIRAELSTIMPLATGDGRAQTEAAVSAPSQRAEGRRQGVVRGECDAHRAQVAVEMDG